MYDIIMSEENDMNKENEDETGLKLEHVDCSNAFNTSRVLIWFFVVKESCVCFDRKKYVFHMICIS